MSAQIYALIPKVMKDIGAVEKTRRNGQGEGYMFRGIDDLLNAISEPFQKHGVFAVPEVLEDAREDRVSKNGNNLIYTRVRVKYTFWAPDGSSFAAVVIGEAMDTGDKSANKAMSSALKNALIQTFVIPTIEDKDTETETYELKAQKTAKAAAVNKAPPQKPAQKPPPVAELMDPNMEVCNYGQNRGKKFRDIPIFELNKTFNHIEANRVNSEPAQHFKRVANAIFKMSADDIPADQV